MATKENRDSRRGMLKKFGAAAGFSIFGAGSANAKPDTLGSVQFTEVSLTHKIKDDVENLFYLSIDELPTHIIDEEERTLYLNDYIAGRKTKLFENSDGVVKNQYNDSYESLPVSFAQVYKDYIVTDTTSGGTGYRPVNGLLTYDGYDFPEIQINRAGRVSIPIIGFSQQLRSNTAETHQLPTETVGLLVENQKDKVKSVYDKDLDRVVDVPVIEKVETPTHVIPSFTVHNHGTLDVVVSSEKIQDQVQNSNDIGGQK